MDIAALVRAHYAQGVTVTRDMAMRFAAGSRERAYWLGLADHYRALSLGIDPAAPISAGAVGLEPL